MISSVRPGRTKRRFALVWTLDKDVEFFKDEHDSHWWNH